jgi:hypothetical protein
MEWKHLTSQQIQAQKPVYRRKLLHVSSTLGAASLMEYDGKQCTLRWDAVSRAEDSNLSQVLNGTTVHTIQTLKKKHSEATQHASHSPELATSHHHLFGFLKYVLRGCNFVSYHNLNEIVHTWLVMRPRTVSCKGLQKLVQHYTTKCVEKHWDYVKNCTFVNSELFCQF